MTATRPNEERTVGRVSVDVRRGLGLLSIVLIAAMLSLVSTLYIVATIL